MSEILIMGMKMPKSCDECRIMMFEDTNCAPELYCGCPIVFKAHPQGAGNRPDYCPLIEIQPHGRLVDADAMCADLATVNPKYKVMIDWCIRIIQAQPTVIEAEGRE